MAKTITKELKAYREGIKQGFGLFTVTDVGGNTYLQLPTGRKVFIDDFNKQVDGGQWDMAFENDATEFSQDDEELTGVVDEKMTPEEQEALLKEIDEHDTRNHI